MRFTFENHEYKYHRDFRYAIEHHATRGYELVFYATDSVDAEDQTVIGRRSFDHIDTRSPEKKTAVLAKSEKNTRYWTFMTHHAMAALMYQAHECLDFHLMTYENNRTSPVLRSQETYGYWSRAIRSYHTQFYPVPQRSESSESESEESE